MMGVVGRKCGTTRIFDDNGNSILVTVILVQPNRVTQLKSIEKEGYYAAQVTTGQCKAKKINKALSGHFVKANVVPGNGLWEFRLSKEELEQLKLGDEIKVSALNEYKYIDVTGISKGRGFAGSHKRHNFSFQYASHGNSLSHRAPGSIGQNQTPGRVIKGKKMPGHMGDKKVTVQSLKVVQIDEQKNLLLVQGGIPGSVNSKVIILPAVKKMVAKKK